MFLFIFAFQSHTLLVLAAEHVSNPKFNFSNRFIYAWKCRPGKGQVGRITAVTDTAYEFSPPFAAPLGAGSVVVVAPYVGKVLMMGNYVANSTTVQIFGSGFDVVYAGNTLEHMYSNSVVHPGQVYQIITQNGLNLDLRCVLLSDPTTGRCRGQNTPQIQHTRLKPSAIHDWFFRGAGSHGA